MYRLATLRSRVRGCHCFDGSDGAPNEGARSGRRPPRRPSSWAREAERRKSPTVCRRADQGAEVGRIVALPDQTRNAAIRPRHPCVAAVVVRGEHPSLEAADPCLRVSRFAALCHGTIVSRGARRHGGPPAGTPTPPVEEWIPRTRPGSNGQPPSPCDGQDAPLPGRCALGGFSSMVRTSAASQATRVVERQPYH